MTAGTPRHRRAPDPRRASRGGSSTSHIAELHGLRGLALALVVVFHLFGQGRVSGGVDVFLLVSGFLVTGSLVRRAERGELRLRDQYARHVTRLVPPGVVVLAAVAMMAVLVLPSGAQVQTGREIVASALFVENWELIASQLAYDAAGPSTSPLQHFWSLAVQGQFFLVFPAVVLVLAAAARGVGRSLRALLGIVAGVATVASFAVAAHLVVVDQQVAYFHSGTRFWEIGVGVLLALVMPYLRAPDLVKHVLAWTGLFLVVSSGFVVDGATVFPGPWALWPVMGAVLVLVGSGAARTRGGPARLLDSAPLRFVADISYSLYLWHWPLLIGYLALRRYPTAGWKGALLVLAVSVALAWLTYRLVERRAQAGRLLLGNRTIFLRSVAATAALVLVAGGASVVLAVQQQAELAPAPADDGKHPGAAVLFPGHGDVVLAAAEPRPRPAVAAKDLPRLGELGCDAPEDAKDVESDLALPCVLHDPPEPTATVAVVGASHEIQWQPAIQKIAQAEGWRLVYLVRHSCRLADEDPVERQSAPCRAWNEQALPLVVDMHPDAVITVGTRTWETGAPDTGEPETVLPGQVAVWRELDRHGIPAVTIRDNPRFAHDVPSCVDRSGDDPRCGRDRDTALAPVSPLHGAPGVPSSAAHVDLSDYLCPDDACPAVIGNVLVYRDDDHLTRTYVRSLAPALHERLRDAAPWLFHRGPSAQR